MDTDNAAVAQFRADMRRAFPDREAKISMWELDGWAAARWMSDALDNCSATLDRQCVEDFLRRPSGYDGHGLFIARSFVVQPSPPTTSHNCLYVARWSDTAANGSGGWLTTTIGKEPVCYDAPNVAYTP